MISFIFSGAEKTNLLSPFEGAAIKQGSPTGSQPPHPPCPKEDLEPLLNPRQSLART